MHPLELVVRHARVATAADVFDCDIGIAGGRIVARAQGLPDGGREIDAAGRIVTPGGVRRWAMVKTGSSYASQSELPLTFGLGSAAKIDGLRVRWPNGRVDTAGSLQANQQVTVREGGGVVSSVAIRRGFDK